MKIQDFVGKDLKYDTSEIAADTELSHEIQSLLIELGLLSEPMEEPFGDRAIAAFTRFQLQNDCVEPDFLGTQTAAKLVEASQMGTRAPAPIITLEALQTTAIKLRPQGADDLAENEKWTLHAGEKLELVGFATERKHTRIVLSQEVQGSSAWYVFSEHVKIFGGGDEFIMPPPPPDEKPAIVTPAKPGAVKLNIPYKSQLNNEINPHGACNVTSMAMCLEFLQIPRHSSAGQFEDELYKYMENKGWSRHSPYGLARMVQDYGAQDAFNSHATVAEVKAWLSAGKPAVTHGFFTDFGHIVVLAGYDDNGFIVHDPNGEWDASGYIRNSSANNHDQGKFQHYSYALIERTCQTDGQFWVHFISK
jgi:uncharacterized protein YvpB